MYEVAFRSIDDTLWKDAGCSSELDYIEQTSRWTYQQIDGIYVWT